MLDALLFQLLEVGIYYQKTHIPQILIPKAAGLLLHSINPLPYHFTQTTMKFTRSSVITRITLKFTGSSKNLYTTMCSIITNTQLNAAILT